MSSRPLTDGARFPAVARPNTVAREITRRIRAHTTVATRRGSDRRGALVHILPAIPKPRSTTIRDGTANTQQHNNKPMPHK